MRSAETKDTLAGPARLVAAIVGVAAVVAVVRPLLGLLSADSPVTEARAQATAAEPNADAVAGGAAPHVNPLDNHPKFARLFEIDTQGRRREGKRVEEGSSCSAKRYYKRIAPHLGFAEGLPDGFGLDALLAHLGYSVIRATDLFTCPTATLMDREALAQYLEARLEAAAPGHELAEGGTWDVLAAGYFSPKTTDVSRPDAAASWRRVVRLKPRPGSPAAEAGLTSALLLSVVYVDDPEADPFEQVPKNIQAILTRDPEDASKREIDPAYFMAFDPASDYALERSTETSWDATETKPGESGLKKYFVPIACMECHGGNDGASTINQFATPHIFDTDSVVERTFPGQDFERIGRGPFAPLYEAGNDFQTESYHTTFNVFRRLNREIMEHNERVKSDESAAAERLLTRIARNWWRLHENTAMYYPPIRRSLPAEEGDAIPLAHALPWSESMQLDRQLVPLLNRYCYRCHGSLIYNVLCRGDVLARASEMADRIKSDDAEYRMPPDRVLPDDVRKTLAKLLEELAKQQAAAAPAGGGLNSTGQPTVPAAGAP